MAKKHSWVLNTCVKCGLMRTPKTIKIRMAIVNHPPWEIYKYKQIYEYHNGIYALTKRPDCK